MTTAPSRGPATRANGPFLRATVLAGSRGCDVVLPNDQPTAALVPALVDLLAVEDRGAVYHLVRVTGAVLPPQTQLGELDLRDGEILRLVPQDEAPLEPVVYDLVDAVDEQRPAGEWSPGTRRGGLAVVAASLLVGAAALTALRWDDARAFPFVLLGLVGLLTSATARAAGQTAVAWVGWVTAAVGFGIATPLLIVEDTAWWWALAAIPLLLAGLGWCVGNPRVASGGIIAWVVAVLAGVVTWRLCGDTGLTAGVVLVTCSMALGLTPRWALASTGAFRLDTDAAEGRELRQQLVGPAVAGSHVSLLAGVVVLAGFATAAAYFTGRAAGDNPWLLALAALAGVAWVVRVRHFPLVLERLALWSVAGGAIAGLVLAWAQRRPEALTWSALALLVMALVVVAAAWRAPGDLQLAAGRRWISRLELIVVVALIPVLVGAFGLYHQLLSTF